jgi:ribose-phosphate pyrophosphokinase
MRKKIVFFCPGHEGLANELIMGERLEKPVPGMDLDLGYIDWASFDDGFPNLRIDGANNLGDTDVIFLADFSRKEYIFGQLAVIYALPSYGINSLKVVLPYFSTGTMDRVCEPGQVVTAKTLARLLSAIPSAAIKTEIVIFDIHALQEQFYFSDQVRVRFLSMIGEIKEVLNGQYNGPIAIAFPDEGAYKRFKSEFKGYDQIICEKRRDGDKRFIAIKDGDPKGKNVIIVDDLIMSGGTLLECAKALQAAGANKVEAFATHAVFPKMNWEDFLAAGIDLYLSNSVPNNTRQMMRDNFLAHDKIEDYRMHILSLSPVIMREVIIKS